MRALASAGPTAAPMLPCSVETRAKMSVTGAQTPSVTSFAVNPRSSQSALSEQDVDDLERTAVVRRALFDWCAKGDAGCVEQVGETAVELHVDGCRSSWRKGLGI